EAHGSHLAVVAGLREIEALRAAGGKQRQEGRVGEVVRGAEPFDGALVAANHDGAADAREKAPELLRAVAEAGARLLQLVGDDLGVARIAPHHLEAKLGIIERRKVLPLLRERRLTRNARIRKERTIENKQHQKLLKQLHILLEENII